jgi:hypothetical protein
MTPLDQQTLQRLFALWADNAQALANGDPIHSDVHTKGLAIVRNAFDEVARAHTHKARCES